MTTRLDFVNTDLINCLICLREFDQTARKPKVLHCGHSLCEECAHTLVDPRSSMLTIRCPTCRLFVTRPNAQHFVTNFQIMGFLAEKEKQDREERAKQSKTPAPQPEEEHLQFKIKRSKSLKIHVATKKDLASPEMYIRKDGNGETSLVIAGKTGDPAEIVNFVNESGIAIERGALTTRIVHDEGRAKKPEQFVKVDNTFPGQSALKSAGPPAKLEEAEFKDSFELKAMEQDGRILFEVVRVGVPEDGKQVFGGSMAKPVVKRQKASTSTANVPSTSEGPVVPEGPVSKRTRRGRGK